MLKFFGKSIFKLMLFGTIFLNYFDFCSGDVLNDVYQNSKLNKTAIVSEGDVNTMGDRVIGDSDSMLVNATQYLLTLTIAFGVTMIMYGGITIILAMGDQSKMQKARKNIIYVVVGIILALSSVTIITVIRSVTKKTLPSSFYFYHNLL